MINAQDLNFDLNDNGIFISGTHTPGEKLQYSVENGNNVSLKKEEIDIEVENIERSSDGTYKGVIRNVEPYLSLAEEGVVEGVLISFSHEHIFSSSHN